jgi:hypothetical protein
MTGSSDWISIVEMDPSTYGDEGGPWKLTIVRTTFPLSEGDRVGDGPGDHWWGLIRFERVGHLSIWRAEDGRVLKVDLKGDESFDDALTKYGLDWDVFGSRALWPGNRGIGFDSWVWTFRNKDDLFPFMSHADFS